MPFILITDDENPDEAPRLINTDTIKYFEGARQSGPDQSLVTAVFLDGDELVLQDTTIEDIQSILIQAYQLEYRLQQE